jgi:hypothetical protein
MRKARLFTVFNIIFIGLIFSGVKIFTEKYAMANMLNPVTDKTVDFQKTQSFQENQLNNLIDFQYPESAVIGSENGVMLLQTTDTPDQISAWYKDKIDTSKINSSGLTKSTINGDILETIIAGNLSEQMRIDITKSNGGKETYIAVSKINLPTQQI